MVARGWGEAKMESNCLMVSFWGNENILELDTSGGCNIVNVTELFTFNG